MTRRERTLGLVFLGTLIAGILVIGGELYLERVQDLDAAISRARIDIAQELLTQRGVETRRVVRRAWTKEEASDEVFIREFAERVEGGGWKMESANLLERKGSRSLFAIRVKGADTAFGTLLGALAAWKRVVILKSVEAFPLTAGTMAALFEVGYETP